MRAVVYSAIAFVVGFIGAGSAAAQATRFATVEDLMGLRDVDGLTLSPDGDFIAFQMRQALPESNSYDIGWYVLNLRSERSPIRIASVGGPRMHMVQGRTTGAFVPPPLAWSGDGSWIAYVRKVGLRTEIWRVQRNGRREERLVHGEAEVTALTYSRRFPVLYFETELGELELARALELEGLAGYLYDRRFFPSYSLFPALPADVAFTPEMADSSELQRRNRRLRVFDFALGRERAAREEEVTEYELLSRPVGVGAQANSELSDRAISAWYEALDPDKQGAYPPLSVIARMGNGEPQTCNLEHCTGQRLIGPWVVGTEIVFGRYEGSDQLVLYAWAIGAANVRLVSSVNGRLLPNSPLARPCVSARNQLVCLFEAAKLPRRIVSIDIATGLMRTIYDPNPEFGLLNVGEEPERIEIRTAEGVRTYGYLVLPPDNRERENLPLVIVTYRCGGFLRGGTGDEYPIFPLAAEGFAVLCFNTPDTDLVRLASESWTEYTRWARGPGHPEKRQIQAALDAAVTLLAERGTIDPDRVGITGLSFGAETVSYALFSMPRLAVAIVSGLGYEPLDYYLYGPSAREGLRSLGMTAPGSADSIWANVSLSENASRVRAPLLVNAADREMLSALQPVTALEEAGVPVEMYVYPNEYHVKWQPAHRLAIYRRNIAWLRFWLRGEESAEGSEQSERWNELRSKADGVASTEATQ